MVSIEELATTFDQAVRNGRVAAGVATTDSTGARAGQSEVAGPSSLSRLVVGPPSAPLTRWLIHTGRADDRHGEAIVDLGVAEYGPHAVAAYEAAFAATLRGSGVRVRSAT